MVTKTGNKNNKKITIKSKNVAELSVKELRDMTNRNKATMEAKISVGFNKNIQLPNNIPGSRFLIMRRKKKNETDDDSMVKVNPIMLARLIRGTGQIIDMKIIRDGGLLIKAKDYKAANSIFQISHIPGFDVTVSEYSQLNKSTGVVHDKSLVAATDEEITEALKTLHCTKVRRVQKTLADGHKIDTGTFFITFGTVVLPKYVTIGYSSLQVSPFVPNPMRCFKCQKFGHPSSSCKAVEKICVNCGKAEHTGEGDKCAEPKKCVNCNSLDHNSMSRDCPEFQYRKKIEEIKVHEQKAHIEAVRLLDARDPLARPSKTPRTTFASVARGSGCKCKCQCKEKAPAMPVKRQRTDLPITDTDEEMTTAPPIVKKMSSKAPGTSFNELIKKNTKGRSWNNMIADESDN